MTEAYSTQELIDILLAEREACLRGDRLNLKASPFIGHTAVDRWLDPSPMQKFSAFQDFRQHIHEYQRDRDVSGLIHSKIQVGDRVLEFPHLHEHLIALDRDIETLKRTKDRVFQFWLSSTEEMDRFLGLQNNKIYEPIEPEAIAAIERRSAWADLWMSESQQFRQIVLKLGWGDPNEAVDRRGSLRSGCESLYAVSAGAIPLG